MSKSILVINTPNACRECPCYEIDGVFGSRCKILECDKGAMTWSVSFNKRNEHCPLINTEEFINSVMKAVEG